MKNSRSKEQQAELVALRLSLRLAEELLSAARHAKLQATMREKLARIHVEEIIGKLKQLESENARIT